jgi:GxxExxY protein
MGKTKAEIEAIAKMIVDACLHVHRRLGPGLLESTYQKCLAHELVKRGLDVKVEVPVSIVYDGLEIDPAYRIDLLVDEAVVIENKAVQELAPLHFIHGCSCICAMLI